LAVNFGYYSIGERDERKKRRENKIQFLNLKITTILSLPPFPPLNCIVYFPIKLLRWKLD
jgi:hypothetical protein